MLHMKKVITDSAYYGLQISLKATIEVFDYLRLKCGYQFLMTSRLNQDNLEVIIYLA